MTDAVKPQRRTMIILLLLFFLPLAAAFILYYGTGWRPVGMSNNGELLTPMRKMPDGADALLGQWALVYVGDGSCTASCQQALVFARQTRLSLNKEMTRLDNALLATSNCCNVDYFKAQHAGLKVFDVSPAAERDELLARLPAKDMEHSLFVVDPLGNIVMRYDVRKSPRGLLDDLKKLLKLSHIG
jgi:hypothetical protein